VLYQEQGRLAEAEAQWRSALVEQADFVPAWLGLGELYLAQGRQADLEDVAGQLANGLGRPVEGSVLRARGHLARREFAAARSLLEAAIAEAPREVWPRTILSHVYLQEGEDWAAAERALRDILQLDPQHAEARRNLEVLRRRSAP
jgi:tetratricopeptide (TPR) repeat protein